MLKWFIDLDGVLVAFVEGVIKFHNLKCTMQDVQRWDGLYDYWDGTIPEFWEALPESFWGNLGWTSEGRAIAELVAHLKPTILTTPPWTGATGKQRWIQKNLPEYWDHGRYLIGPDKTCVARTGAVLIDDAEHNIDPWIEAGGIGILVPRPWNRLRSRDTYTWVKEQVEFMEGLN